MQKPRKLGERLKPNDEPSEEEILQLCSEIQDGWDEAKEISRGGGSREPYEVPTVPDSVFFPEG